MAELILIRQALHASAPNGNHAHIRLPAARTTLAKRRWRGVAENGKEFGFDLGDPLHHDDTFYAEGPTRYVIQQTPEEVLEIPVPSAEQAARVAWSLGNLHFAIEVLPEAVRVPEDSAVLQLLARERLAFRRVTCLFLPLATGAHHHHGHDHG
jgi:urease accessory protein